jgi:ubiquinone/menaquinone biosynthesis C-methylase UbiE
MGELKEKASRYSEAFDGAAPLADEENRLRKAEKIKAVLEQEGVMSRRSLRILDIGCSFGIILKSLTPKDGAGIGVDIDKKNWKGADNVSFVRADAENLPFSSASFDIVICNHVYEHTDSPEQMLSEIKRVLSDTGVCYFAGPNKYDFIEPHYGLPLLSWLPRTVADGYLRLTGRGKSYSECPYSYPELKKLLSDFEVVSYTEKIIRDPVQYAATDVLPRVSLKRLVAIILLKVAPFFFPGFVFILRRPQGI